MGPYKSPGSVDDRRVTADGFPEALLDVTDEERGGRGSFIECHKLAERPGGAIQGH